MPKAVGLLLGLALAGMPPHAGIVSQPGSATPREAVDGLLAADRAYSKASSQTDVVSGLTAMFAPDVMMPIPAGQFARGADAVASALRSNPDNLKSHAEWTPVRGGVSADGQHGFTFGYMQIRQPGDKVVPAKYLAYWIKSADGKWRVAAYKRSRPATDKPASAEMMPPSLPERMVPVSTDAAAIERHRESLAAAERAFSDEAQKIGIGPAFVKFGSADAVNAGPPTESSFVVGSEAIGKMVGAGYGAGASPVSWSADSVLVASSGDLGVTFGMIRANGPAADGKQQPPIPFFTIWRRPGPDSPWKYIAE